MTSPHKGKDGEAVGGDDNNDNTKNGGKDMNGTDGGAATAAAKTPAKTANGGNPTPKTPENISKEELLDVLQKMNKKMKTFSAQRTQLAERLKATEGEKDRLLKLVKDEILSGDVELTKDGDTVQQLERAWRVVDERNSLALQELQKEYKTVAQQCKQEVEEVKKASEVETQAKLQEMRAEIAAETLASGNEAWESMREQLTKRHQEEAALLRQQLHEQYDLQLAQQEEEFAQKLQDAITSARSETEERVRAETAGASASEGAASAQAMEELKAKHATQVNKL